MEGRDETKHEVFITRLYTGQDGQTHAEKIEANFTAGTPSDVAQLMKVTGAEIHRARVT
jgi:hypothetical protein